VKYLVKALTIGASRYAQQPEVTWQTGATEPSKTGLRNWLIDGTGYSIASHRTSGDIALECIDDSWARSNGSDLIANREAAIESLFPRVHKLYSHRSLAWPIVTTYYSFYFAAQTFLRCLGLGSIYIEDKEAQLLSAVLIGRGFSTRFVAGNYVFAIELSNPVNIVLRKFGSGGGAHKQFWNGFQRSQNAIHEALLVSPGLNTLSTAQRQAADSEFEQLIQTSFIDTSVSTNVPDFEWCSKLRNSVNYRFDGHAWLMNWQHSTGLITNHELIIQRYLSGLKELPEVQRNFSKNHLAYVAARFCQLVKAATLTLSAP
jgi:hypothetical protein